MSAVERKRRNGWIASAALVAAVLLFWLYRILLSGTSVKLLTSDVFLYYLPVYELLYGAVREGRLPIWNPYQLCGIPGLASLQAGFFYPVHVLYLFLPVKVAFGVSNVMHLGLVAVSMAVLVRRIGLGLPAALAAALVLALRGRYPGMVFFPNMLEASAWLAPGAIAVVAITRGEGRRWAAWLAVCTGMSLLAGYPQASVYVVYSWGALLAIFLIAERGDSRATARAIGLFAVGLLVGAMLASIQLFPGVELTAQGTRSPGALERWQQFPFGWPGKGMGLVASFTEAVQAPFPMLPLSLGSIALVLLPVALFARRFRVLVIGALVTAAIVILFSMGPSTPFFDWLARLPALGWFRFPRRSLFMADFFLALVVAVACYVVARMSGGEPEGGPREVPRKTMLVCVFSAGVAVWVALALATADPPQVVPVCLALLTAAVVAASSFGLWRRSGFRSPSASVPLLLAGLLLFEFFAAEPNRQMLYFVPGAMDVYAKEREIFSRIEASGDRAWIRSIGINPPLPPKLASYFHMRSVGDYEPLNLRRQAEYFTFLMEGRLEPRRRGRPYSGRLKHLTAPTYPGALTERGRLLDVAAVRWIVVSRTGASRGELSEYIRDRGLRVVDVPDPEFVLLENPNAAPRAYVVHDIRPAPDPLALMTAMSSPEFDPLVSSWVEGPVGDPVVAPAPRGHAARIALDEETRVEIEAELSAPGMLVLADSYYPGWRAFEGERELTIQPVNHLFRGVALPAGEHRVRFEYDPWTLRAGAGSSTIAIVALLFLARRRRDAERAAARGRNVEAEEEP